MPNQNTLQIAVGTSVEFDSDHGPQTGTVTNILPCLSNGRVHATIEIDHDLDGIIFNMPLDELTRAMRPPLTLNSLE